MNMDETPSAAERPDGRLAIPLQLPSPELDPKNYRVYLDDFDLADDEERELFRALESILRTCVQMGFDISCVKLFESPTSECAPDSAIVESQEGGGSSR